MDDKVYYPEVLEENPYPAQSNLTSFDTSSDSGSNQTYGPKTTEQQMFPIKRIADELSAVSLNTRTKKILGSFQFTPSGAIQIGNYQDGEAGDIRISPSGILGRNIQGDTTFFLDGETGDAAFKGTLQAGTLVGGDNKVQIDSNANGGNIAIYDSASRLAIFIGFM